MPVIFRRNTGTVSRLMLPAVLILGLPILALSWFSTATTLFCQNQFGAGNPPRIGVSLHGTLYFSAQITDEMAAQFEALAKHPPRPITRIRITSGGGDMEDAEQMSEAIKPLVGIPMEVPSIGSCQSACVELLANAPGPIRIAPEATIMFHAKATRIGFATCGLCGVNNRVIVWLSMNVPIWNRNRRAMLPWARSLSDKLPVLFSLCPVNPLDTQVGMTLTGAQFNGLREGMLEPKKLQKLCPKRVDHLNRSP